MEEAKVLIKEYFTKGQNLELLIEVLTDENKFCEYMVLKGRKEPMNYQIELLSKRGMMSNDIIQ